jgi:hypothetical protein
MNRFDLEEAIASLWNFKDDINLVCENLTTKEYDQDKILNVLSGIAELHDMRVHRIMDIFENLIHAGIINSEDSESLTKYADLTVEQEINDVESFFKSEPGIASCSKHSF